MIVIYTADVERSETPDLLDAGCLRLETQSVFLSEMDPEEISKRLYQKVIDQIPLSDEENESIKTRALCWGYCGNIESAHTQIEEKQYETELISAGYKPDQIRKYGFAFKGKECLIG